MYTIDEIQRICNKIGIKPTKSKGQNFLVDEEVLDDIVKTASLSESETVLEIGPGFGVLTEELVKVAGKVVAVELDRELFKYLKDRFRGVENLELVEGDFISLFHCSIVPLLGKNFKVVANLPYQITSKILRVLLESEKHPSEIVVMVQKEVGERICAKPGDMSVLSVAVQYFGTPEIVRVVDKTSFWPAPEVNSVILKIQTSRYNNQTNSKHQDAIPNSKFQNPNFEQDFFRVVKVGFSSRRKMLRKNLGNIFAQNRVDKAMQDVGIDLKARAQELSFEDWLALIKKLN